ncbi:hypothetical protein Peur_051352 [Populus x canadensis]|jgi:hypothetical protein
MSNCDGYFLFIWLAHCLLLKVHSLNQVGEWVLFTIYIYSDYSPITLYHSWLNMFVSFATCKSVL